jgi:hypothetical protein
MIRFAIIMNPIKISLIALMLAALGFGAVQAQFNTFGAPSNLSIANVNAYVSVQLRSAAVREAQRNLDRIQARNQTNQQRQTTARAQAQSRPQTAFKPGSQRLLLNQFVRNLSNDPAVVRQLTEAFTEGFRAFEAEARRLGRPNNVAMAFTYLIGVCYLVHHGEEPTETALMNLQANLDAAFGASATFKRLTDAERQRFHEAFVLMATLPLMGYTVAVEQKDQALLDTYREIAGVALETALSVRPEKLKFTATGLERR